MSLFPWYQIVGGIVVFTIVCVVNRWTFRKVRQDIGDWLYLFLVVGMVTLWPLVLVVGFGQLIAERLRDRRERRAVR